MKEQGYSEGYIYDHDTPQGFSGQEYFRKTCQDIYFIIPLKEDFEERNEKKVKILLQTAINYRKLTKKYFLELLV